MLLSGLIPGFKKTVSTASDDDLEQYLRSVSMSWMCGCLLLTVTFSLKRTQTWRVEMTSHVPKASWPTLSIVASLLPLLSLILLAVAIVDSNMTPPDFDFVLLTTTLPMMSKFICAFLPSKSLIFVGPRLRYVAMIPCTQQMPICSLMASMQTWNQTHWIWR